MVITLNCDFCQRNALIDTFIFLIFAYLGYVASEDNLGELIINLKGLGRKKAGLSYDTGAELTWVAVRKSSVKAASLLTDGVTR
jgi:hypothetical protein